MSFKREEKLMKERPSEARLIVVQAEEQKKKIPK